MDLLGLKQLKKYLKDKFKVWTGVAKQLDQKSVIVGYTASYAVFVHENVEMKGKGLPRKSGKGYYWDPQGVAQAKFLEAPARTESNTMGKIVAEAMKKGIPLDQSLYLAGLHLQRESQKLCPVDTGNLKNSAFTRKE